MKKTVDILVGISASGKSTYTDGTLAEHPNGKTFNADFIREKLYGNAMIQGDGNEVFGVLFDEYSQALKDNVTDYMVIDNTSLSCKLRKRYIDLANTVAPMFEHEIEIRMIFFEPNLERSLQWNTARDRHVPEDVIRRQFANYEYANDFEKENCTILFADKMK